MGRPKLYTDAELKQRHAARERERQRKKRGDKPVRKLRYGVSIEQRKAERAAYQRAYAHAHPERMRAMRKRQKERDPERWFAAQARYEKKRRAARLANKEANAARVRDYHRRNPEKLRARIARRRAGIKESGLSFTAEEARKIRLHQRGKCAACKIKMGRKAHLDHIIPIARGGSNEAANLQWLCAPCNLSKGSKDPIEFMQARGFLL